MVIAAAGVWFNLAQPMFPQRGDVIVERVDTVIPNTVGTPLKGKDSDTAVIWVSGLEWAPDLEQMKEHFDNLDT